MNINDYGFLRVAAASPKLRVADCDYNTAEMKRVIERARSEEVQLLCFPELCITAYTCGDLFFQKALLQKALESLESLSRFLQDGPSPVTVAGLPLRIGDSLCNVAAILSGEGILGFVPKTCIPNSNEYYEKRWFVSGESLAGFATGAGTGTGLTVNVGNRRIPVFPGGAIFRTPFAGFGVEICEDLWTPVPPSSRLAVQGAELIFNLSASNELVGKNRYRKSLVLQQSGRCHAAYVYASAGWGESTTDTVFSGACFIAENGVMLAESERFSPESELIIADVDVEALRHDRLKNTNYMPAALHGAAVTVDCRMDVISPAGMYRRFNPHPFIPTEEECDESLREVFDIQTHGLAKRLLHTGIEKVTVGVSGGLDSTLALLVCVGTFDLLGLPRRNIHGITMPGFGTTGRTHDNAVSLMKSLGVTVDEISILDAVTRHFSDIGHDPDTHDVTYENCQARERTQILMDYANRIGGLTVGTGNMSELALGWTTYNGDHMSMYGVNAGVPKTLVASLVRWIAGAGTVDGEASREILYDILDTPFSPELLPADGEGNIAQKTEHFVGPYELHDFFLHRMIRYGDAPSRIRFMAGQAFGERYSSREVEKWLKLFCRRFFAQQFKRSCMPDGPKVGTVSLSPRGDWRMPSDAAADAWLAEPEGVESLKR
ncbi:MAG: NAD(+) synthase [Proteiniphilum sp.]|nr:NAD(+) synthase [Proteiniphilum sp.]